MKRPVDLKTTAGLVALLVIVLAWGWFIWFLCRPGLPVLHSLGIVAGSYLVIGIYMGWLSLPGAFCQKVVIIEGRNRHERQQ